MEEWNRMYNPTALEGLRQLGWHIQKDRRSAPTFRKNEDKNKNKILLEIYGAS